MAEVGWSGRGKCIQLYLKNNKKMLLSMTPLFQSARKQICQPILQTMDPIAWPVLTWNPIHSLKTWVILIDFLESILFPDLFPFHCRFYLST